MLTKYLLKQNAAWKFGQVRLILPLFGYLTFILHYRDLCLQLSISKAKMGLNLATSVGITLSWLDLLSLLYSPIPTLRGRAPKPGCSEMTLVPHTVSRVTKNRSILSVLTTVTITGPLK